jgi:hypothetical protein
VINYSPNGADLLKRRKLRRDLLFQYLVKVNVVVDPRAGKVKLMKTILEHWGTNNVDILDLMEVSTSSSNNNAFLKMYIINLLQTYIHGDNL